MVCRQIVKLWDRLRAGEFDRRADRWRLYRLLEADYLGKRLSAAHKFLNRLETDVLVVGRAVSVSLRCITR